MHYSAGLYISRDYIRSHAQANARTSSPTRWMENRWSVSNGIDHMVQSARLPPRCKDIWVGPRREARARQALGEHGELPPMGRQRGTWATAAYGRRGEKDENARTGGRRGFHQVACDGVEKGGDSNHASIDEPEDGIGPISPERLGLPNCVILCSQPSRSKSNLMYTA